ncbi:PREDICTED: GTPase Era, mitochondrial-like, partial [Ceratosolen solmsi marchali]|uniref:GTPase Era, mitochondrial-like n=1 Tax=Ceratosolen solmsi marchali TaxID=326594 RepID=A0AAJ6YC07_9HYME
MISALKGDGVDDLRNYFLDSAKLKPWNYNKYTFTDQSFQIIIQQTVKANLLNNLPQEIPYLLNTFAEHIEKNNDGSLNIVVNVSCPSTRISRIVIGKQGERIKLIAQQAEQTMCKIFQTSVRLKIIVH